MSNLAPFRRGPVAVTFEDSDDFHPMVLKRLEISRRPSYHEIRPTSHDEILGSQGIDTRKISWLLRSKTYLLGGVTMQERLSRAVSGTIVSFLAGMMQR
jgi:hypothetical protein